MPVIAIFRHAGFGLLSPFLRQSQIIDVHFGITAVVAVEAANLKVPIAAGFPLGQAALAHKRLAQGHTRQDRPRVCLKGRQPSSSA